MPHLPKDTQLDSWHRYFAMEANNRAWELAALSSRSDAESRELLDTAHASAYHWNQVGTELNRVRANYLLAEVHALLGMGDSALDLASAVKAYFIDKEIPDWERAFVLAIHAHSAAVAGNARLHASAYAEATRALEAIADPEDRRIVNLTFVQIPRPGD